MVSEFHMVAMLLLDNDDEFMPNILHQLTWPPFQKSSQKHIPLTASQMSGIIHCVSFSMLRLSGLVMSTSHATV